jgi:hypothetical protein
MHGNEIPGETLHSAEQHVMQRCKEDFLCAISLSA